jgi:flagellar biosynthesis chaperone FliJ
MKKFHFHLEQALRWRRTQAELRNVEALACAGAVAEAERAVERLRAEHEKAALELTTNSNGATLAAGSAFLEKSRLRIVDALKKLEAARAALKAATEKLVEADRNAKLLEKMRETRLREWTVESEREMEAFAAESFLNRR